MTCNTLQKKNYRQEDKLAIQDQSPTSNNNLTMNGQVHDDLISSIRKKIYKYPKQCESVAREPNRRFRSVRKLTQKALKTLKIKVSEFSKDINETKQTVNEWFKKKIDHSEEKERIIFKSREWLQKHIATLDYKQFFEIAQKYIKSEELDFNVNQLKKNPNIQDFAEIPFSTVIQNIPPGGYNQLIKQKRPEYPSATQSLVLIRLKIPLCYLTKKENSFMTERLYWDIEDEQTEAEIFQNLTIILLDLFNDSYSHLLKNLLYQELMVITQICYFQLVVQLENHQKIQSSWQSLFESGFDIYQEPILLDGIIPIRLKIKHYYQEDIQWDTSYNLQYIDEFAQDLVREQQLDKKFAILVASQISSQISKFLENRLEKISNIFSNLIDQGDQKDTKSKLNITFKDNLDILKNGEVINQQKFPANHELQVFFKKYVEYLPNEISKYFGSQTKIEKSEICIDIDDIKRNERQFNLQLNQNEYLDPCLYRELVKGSLNKMLILK